MSQASSQIRKNFRSCGTGSRRQRRADYTRLQADRHHHLHRLQGVRGRVSRMERLSVPRDGVRQHLPDHARHGVELLEPDQVQRSRARDGSIMLLMRKDQCMHCAEPGCLAACPADGAIVQYSNGIVDFQQEHCIGCGYCVSGCPFNIPKFNPATKKMFKCTLCVDRVTRGSGAGLHQILPHRLSALRHEGRHEGSRRDARPAAARALRIRKPAFTIRQAWAARA